VNCAIERELQRMQSENPENHLPLEYILEVLHDEEYAEPPFSRRVDVPRLGPREARHSSS
jgi:hypothetical protein